MNAATLTRNEIHTPNTTNAKTFAKETVKPQSKISFLSALLKALSAVGV